MSRKSSRRNWFLALAFGILLAVQLACGGDDSDQASKGVFGWDASDWGKAACDYNKDNGGTPCK